MDKKEFSQARHLLGKTQNQLAQLLGISPKAVQSFEQGWRGITVHIERQVLFLLAMSRLEKWNKTPCWERLRCTGEMQEVCPAWKFHSGYLCWFMNGVICRGEARESWEEKMEICRKCKVFTGMFPNL